MRKEINSIKNKTVCEAKKLKQKKYREQTGMFLSEGYRNVLDSMKKAEPETVFVQKDCNLHIPDTKNSYIVSKEVFAQICDTNTPQGVAAVFSIPKERKITVFRVLLLHGVSDPGNLGTILRTALATGFTDVVLDERCADIYSPKVVRSAMSALFSLNLIRVKDLTDTVLDLKKMKYTVYAAALTDEAVSVYDTAFSKKTALIFGSEAHGISDELLAISDIVYIIPMNSEIESLNVAVAAGVSMYECQRQNNFANK